MPRGIPNSGRRTRRLQVVDQRDIAPAIPRPDETPRQRLRRIGPTRVAGAIRALRHLQQLGNPSVYALREGDAEKVVASIKSEVEQLEFVLKNPGKPAMPVTFEDDEE